jgi:hypothetical protein
LLTHTIRFDVAQWNLNNCRLCRKSVVQGFQPFSLDWVSKTKKMVEDTFLCDKCASYKINIKIS